MKFQGDLDLLERILKKEKSVSIDIKTTEDVTFKKFNSARGKYNYLVSNVTSNKKHGKWSEEKRRESFVFVNSVVKQLYNPNMFQATMLDIYICNTSTGEEHLMKRHALKRLLNKYCIEDNICKELNILEGVESMIAQEVVNNKTNVLFNPDSYSNSDKLYLKDDKNINVTNKADNANESLYEIKYLTQKVICCDAGNVCKMKPKKEENKREPIPDYKTDTKRAKLLQNRKTSSSQPKPQVKEEPKKEQMKFHVDMSKLPEEVEAKKDKRRKHVDINEIDIISTLNDMNAYSMYETYYIANVGPSGAVYLAYLHNCTIMHNKGLVTISADEGKFLAYQLDKVDVCNLKSEPGYQILGDFTQESIVCTNDLLTLSKMIKQAMINLIRSNSNLRFTIMKTAEKYEMFEDGFDKPVESISPYLTNLVELYDNDEYAGKSRCKFKGFKKLK